MVARAFVDDEQAQLREAARRAVQHLRRGRRGITARIASELRLRAETVAVWKMVPAEYVFDVGRIARVSVMELRPDIFNRDPLRAKGRVFVPPPPPRAGPKQPD